MSYRQRYRLFLKTSLLFLLLSFFLSFSFAATLSVDSNETFISDTVTITGIGFTPDSNIVLANYLESASAWWDGYNEQWGFPIVDIPTDGSGNFSYDWNVPYDFRLSPGKQQFKVGTKIKSALYWTGGGQYPVSKNGITCDGTSCFVASAYTAPNGGVEKFSMVNGNRDCNITITTAGANDIASDGTYVYSVFGAAANNLQRTLMADCSGTTAFTTAAVLAYSIKISSDGNAFITYAASTAPRKYKNLQGTPLWDGNFAPTLKASIANDICISPDNNRVFVGFADGNVSAYDFIKGGQYWNSDPDDVNGPVLAVLGLDCDANAVYVAKGLNNTALGLFFGGSVYALDRNTGALLWRSQRINSLYVYGQYNNIRCDSENCYAVVQAPVLGTGTGIAGAPIIQIRKSDGTIGWVNWRSWAPASTAAYGTGATHGSPQTLWIDNDVNGFIYPVYSNGRIQKISKNDVDVQSFPDANLWVRGNTNLYSFVMNPTKNVFYSNEYASFNFKAVDRNGMVINTDDNRFNTSYLRFSTINAFSEFTATETASSQFMDPRIMTAYVTTVTAQPNPTPYNYLRFMYGAIDTIDGSLAPGHCPSTLYTNNLFGWHILNRYCLYENLDLNHATLGHTQNGVYLSGTTTYALVTPKKWDNFPITKTFGTDNWAWLSDHNSGYNQVLGFATRFGADQNEVWSNHWGRTTFFSNTAAATSYIYDHVDATLDFNNVNPALRQWHESYFLFKPKGSGVDGNRHWQYVEQDTNAIANPMIISVSENVAGDTIDGNAYSNRVDFNATEPGLFDRNAEVFWFDVNLTGGIRPDCTDLIVTDESNNIIGLPASSSPAGLWQVDANTNTCFVDTNYALFIQDNFAKDQTKQYRLYYNAPAVSMIAPGYSDLAVYNVSGSCAAGTDSIDVNSQSWFSWANIGEGGATETVRFKLDGNDQSWFASTTHYTLNLGYMNAQTTGTGAGTTAEGLCASGSTCGTAVNVFASRCYQRSANQKIFARMDMNTANITATPHLGSAQTRKIMSTWYFFNNNGRVRVKTKLDAPLVVMTTGISQNYHPYYFWGTYSLVPQGTYNNDWFNWSGRKELMDAYVPATISADKKTAVLTPTPLPLMFTIDYNGEHFVNVSSSNAKPGKGCTVHKVWPYFSWRPVGPTDATGATTFTSAYTTDFISCDSDLNTSIPSVGNNGYVNAFPKESIYGTGLNKYVDPNLIAKFYLKPNLFIPDNRENRWLPPLALNAQYGTSAKLSSYILDVCPSEEYGYKGFDDFLSDLSNLISSSSTHLVTSNRNNISCATSVIKFTTNVGSLGTFFLFQRDVNVIVGENARPDPVYPSNLYAASGSLSVNGSLDYTFTQKSTYFWGKWFFTSSSFPFVIHAYTTTGAEQLAGQTRYAWAPSFAFNKKAYDESGFWSKADQNMTYYQSPCNWNFAANQYGDFDLGPGWINNFAPATEGVFCPSTLDNIEKYASFRPARASLYPTAAITASWAEHVMDGRPNKTTAITDLGIDAALYSRHNSLWDYSHYSDYTQVVDSFTELNEGVKHPNSQPWHCDFSRAESKSFCLVPATTTTLIYTYSPGVLGVTRPWSPYYQSDREYSVIRDYIYNRWFDTTVVANPTYDFVTEQVVNPMLSATEITVDMLYTSNNPDDYNTLFRVVFPDLTNARYQTQFLLRDWKNTAFMILSRDSREYLRLETIDLNGFMMKNSARLANAPIIVQLFKNSEPTVPLLTYQTTTDGNGDFSYSYTVPNTAEAGLYFFKANYNNDDINGTVSFKVSPISIIVTLNQTAYKAGDLIVFSAAVSDVITGLAITDADLTISIVSPTGNTLVSNVSMTNAGSGTYTYSTILDLNAANGIYVATITAATSSNTGYTTSSFAVSAVLADVLITNNFQFSDANRQAVTQIATLQNLVPNAISDYILYYQLSEAVDPDQIRSVTIGETPLVQIFVVADLNNESYRLSFDAYGNPVIYLSQDFLQNETKTATIISGNKYFTDIEHDYNYANYYSAEVENYCSVLLTPAAQTICANARQRILDINGYYAQTETLHKVPDFRAVYLNTNETYELLLDDLAALRSYSTNQSSCRLFVPGSWMLDSNVSIAALMLGPSAAPLSGLSPQVKLYNPAFSLLSSYTLNEFESGWYYNFFIAPSTGGGYNLIIDQNIGTNRFQCAASFDVNQSSATASGGTVSGGLTADQNYTLYQIFFLVQDINATTSSIDSIVRDINSTVNAINSKIDTVQASLTDMNTLLQGIDANVYFIKTNLITTASITDLNSTLLQVLGYSIDINNAVAGSNSLLSQLSSSISDVNSGINTVNSTVVDINNTLNACSFVPSLSICGKLDALSLRLLDLNSAVMGIRATTNDINSTANSISATVSTINSTSNSILLTVTDINTTSNFIKEKIILVDENIQLVRTGLNDVESMLDCSSFPAESVCQRLSDINAALNDFNSQTALSLLQIIGYVDTLETAHTAIDENLLLILNELNCTSPGGNDVCNRLITIQGYTDSLESGVSDINSTVNTVSSTVLDINSTSTAISSRVLDLNQATQIILSDTDSLKQSAAATQSMISDVNSRIVDINAIVQSTKIIVTDINTAVTDINRATSDINTTVSSIQTDITTIKGVVTDINTSQQTIVSALSTMQAILNDVNDTVHNIHTSQIQKFTAILSDFQKIEPGAIYYAKLWVFDFNGSPKNADSTPKITSYDPSRNKIVENVDMNFSETGIYTYSFSSTSGQTAGMWETIASVTVNGSTVKPSDWWELTGNPPEVKINAITDTTVPTITANVTITNEGTTSQEYQYEYCIVSEQTNQCGGGDDIDYASGAKSILADQSWNPDLTLNANNLETYWFKVKVYYGSETSAASKQFTATEEGPETPQPPGGGGAAGGGGGGFAVLPGGGKGIISIIEMPSEKAIMRGSIGFIEIRIKNIGNGKLTGLALSLDGPFIYGLEQEKTELNPNEESSFVLKVSVPSTVEFGDHIVTVRISSKEDSKEAKLIFRVLGELQSEIVVLDIRTSKIFMEGAGSVDVLLLNRGKQDMNIGVSLIVPLDWQIEKEKHDFLIKAGEQKRITFNVNASYRKGVQSLVLAIYNNDKINFAGLNESKMLFELLTIVYEMPKETGIAAPLAVSPDFITFGIIAAAFIALILVMIVFARELRKILSSLKATQQNKRQAGLFEIKNIDIADSTFSISVKPMDKDEEETFIFELKELAKTDKWKKKIETAILSRQIEKPQPMPKTILGTIVEKKETALELKVDALERKIEEQKKEIEGLKRTIPKTREQALKEKAELLESLAAMKKVKENGLATEEIFSEFEKELNKNLLELEKFIKTKQELETEKKELGSTLKQFEKMHQKGVMKQKQFLEIKGKIEAKLAKTNKLLEEK